MYTHMCLRKRPIAGGLCPPGVRRDERDIISISLSIHVCIYIYILVIKLTKYIAKLKIYIYIYICSCSCINRGPKRRAPEKRGAARYNLSLSLYLYIYIYIHIYNNDVHCNKQELEISFPPFSLPPLFILPSMVCARAPGRGYLITHNLPTKIS